MLAGLRILTILADRTGEGAIRAALPSTAPVHSVDLADAVEYGAVLVEELDPGLVLVGCSAYSESALDVIRTIAALRPDCPLVVVYDGSPNGFMDATFDAGADDLIALPQPPEQLAFALEKVIARRRGSAAVPPTSPMITVLGPKGGTGKTLTACNLAVSLARAGTRPVIVDLDLQFGDIGLALGLSPERTIYELAIAGGSLDCEKIDSFLAAHSSGARVLLAPTRPDHTAAVGIPFLRRVFEILRMCYDFVIVDTPPAFTPEVIAAVDSSSHLCVVGALDALALKNTKIAFETLVEMGYDPAATTFVLNRGDSSVGISNDDVRRVLGRAPAVVVPSDRAVLRALTAGRTIVEAEPRSGAARAFAALADHYLDVRAGRTVPNIAKSEQSRNEPTRRLALLRKGA